MPRRYHIENQAAVWRHAGAAAVSQPCQLHKRRNVIDHLPEEYRENVE